MYSSIGFPIIATISALAYILGFYLYKKNKSDLLTQAVFSISGVSGASLGYCILNFLGLESFADFAVRAMLVSGLLFVMYAIACWKTKKPILHLFTALYATWFIYVSVIELIKGSGFDPVLVKDIFAYTSVLISIGYFMYGTKISSKPRNSTIVSVFVFLAFSLTLLATLFLGGIWNIAYLFIIIGLVRLAQKIKSGVALIPLVLASCLYILKLTLLYFGRSISLLNLIIEAIILLILLTVLAWKLYTKTIKNLNKN